MMDEEIILTHNIVIIHYIGSDVKTYESFFLDKWRRARSISCRAMYHHTQKRMDSLNFSEHQNSEDDEILFMLSEIFNCC